MTSTQDNSQGSKARGSRITGLIQKVLEPAVLRAGSSTLSNAEVQRLLGLLQNTTQTNAVSASEGDVRRWIESHGPKWLKNDEQGAAQPAAHLHRNGGPSSSSRWATPGKAAEVPTRKRSKTQRTKMHHGSWPLLRSIFWN